MGNPDKMDFKWGKKRRKGGAKGDVQFYESFRYDGVQYSLYDTVYLFTHNPDIPDIGKLIKIWELPNKSKKIKVLWFFRPSEVSRYAGDLNVHPKEIFLACGTGKGLTNVNPLEAIAGKCSVICTSTDERNRRPSLEEVNMAHHVFSRTFNVEKLTFSAKLGEKIADIDVKFFLNKRVPETYCTPITNSYCEQDSVEVVEQLGTLKSAALEKVDLGVMSDHLLGKGAVTLKASSDIKENCPMAESGTKAASRPASLITAEAKTRKCSVENVAEAVDTPLQLTKQEDAIDSHDGNNECNEQSVKRRYADGIGVLDTRAPKTARVSDQVRNTTQNKKVKDTFTKNPSGSSLGSLKIKNDDKMATLQADKLQKTSPEQPKVYGQVVDVTRRPDVEKSRWFTNLVSEERFNVAMKEGTLVLLQNLDPTYCSSDVEDIIWHGFRESCSAKVIPYTMAMNPPRGDALIIMKTKEIAERVVRELQKGCLLLSNGRPLIARTGILFSKQQNSFPGHLVIPRIELQHQKENREAMSTSHSAQPNSLEYDMAMEWRLLQDRFDAVYKKLFKLQREELREQKGKLKETDH